MTRFALPSLDDMAAELAAMPPDSGRNSALNRLAFEAYTGYGYDPADIRGKLGSAAVAAGLPVREVERTLDSALGSKRSRVAPGTPPVQASEWTAAWAKHPRIVKAGRSPDGKKMVKAPRW
ncbi:MAG: hypothetical protein ACREMY_15650, partial [bacterium]